ncbi:MAG: hypothetical protein U5Q44_12250 [Dehalococcoidia bacterium]|nr:hypothetical protein [Dehalococcoidia bacterium]
MKHFRRTVLVALAAGLLAVAAMTPGALAAETAEPQPTVRTVESLFQEGEAAEGDVWQSVVWTLVGIAVGAVVLGVLYLLKRRVGAFPENPEWVAPIYITPSAENPTEETFGLSSDHDDPGGGHDAQGAHGAAH